MWELIIQYLVEYWPLGIWIIIAVALTWYVSGIVNKLNAVKEKVENLPCEEHGKRAEEQSVSNARIEQAIKNLPCEVHGKKIEESSLSNAKTETKIELILSGINYLIDGQKSEKGLIVNPYTQKRSPMTITKEGHELVERLGLDKTVDSRWDSINGYIQENVSSKNPYDIQQFLREQTSVFPEKFLGDSDIDLLKKVAYAEGYTLVIYLTVISILIRDRYFAEHNIDVEEVDRYDPRKPA
ncbi:MAG: hypothetical protein LBT78_03345 [Tannerella sp.]|jgi:CRISPR/Cas system-associated exonuclease Cas4 (RecB family)|nr:hypothetical protein [Tannerella sp.]